ncbi:MAG: hypothetical protein AB1331_10470 [Bacillota bacterium]
MAEETGIRLPFARFTGPVTWEGATETNRSGMYVFTADLPDPLAPWNGVRPTDEGELVWVTETEAAETGR